MSRLVQAAEAGNGAELLRELRARSLYSPYFFQKTVLKHVDAVPHLHQHDLELVVDRAAEGHRKQFIEWPRRFLKTSTFTVGLGMWFVLPVTREDRYYATQVLGIDETDWDRRARLHNQNLTQLYAFETETNACLKIGIVKNHLEENQLLRACFPEIAYQGAEQPWSEHALRLRRTGEGTVEAEPTFQAVGVGGALQSRHYDIIWADDIVGERASTSQSEMERTKGWWRRLPGAEKIGEQTKWFGVSNRWGYSDLNSYIREEEPDWWFYTRAAWELLEGVETPIWPERYPMDVLERIRLKMKDWDFCCQFLNQPRPPGEQAIDVKKIHRYTTRDGKIYCSCGYSVHPNHLLRYVHYDPYAAKGVRSTSAPAIVAVGCSEDKHTFLLEYFVTRGDYAQIYDKLFDFNQRWKPHKFTYEDVGAQNMTEFYIRQHQLKPEYAGRRFPPIVPVTTHGKPKEIRIRDYLFPVFERGKFSARDSHQMFFRMLDTFPFDVPDHDYDLLDALAQGASNDKYGKRIWRYPVGSGDDAEDRDTVKDAYIAELGRPYGYCSQTERVA